MLVLSSLFGNCNACHGLYYRIEFFELCRICYYWLIFTILMKKVSNMPRLFGNKKFYAPLLDDDDAECKVSDGELATTDIFDAVEKGNLAYVKGYIERGVDVNSRGKPNQEYPTREGVTPLALAARYGHMPVVRYLVEEAGADIVLANVDGVTPLHLAADGDQAEVCRYLIEHGAEDSMDEGGLRAVDYANKADTITSIVDSFAVAAAVDSSTKKCIVM